VEIYVGVEVGLLEETVDGFTENGFFEGISVGLAVLLMVGTTVGTTDFKGDFDGRKVGFFEIVLVVGE
jgi:hypothetical protein